MQMASETYEIESSPKALSDINIPAHLMAFTSNPLSLVVYFLVQRTVIFYVFQVWHLYFAIIEFKKSLALFKKILHQYSASLLTALCLYILF